MWMAGIGLFLFAIIIALWPGYNDLWDTMRSLVDATPGTTDFEKGIIALPPLLILVGLFMYPLIKLGSRYRNRGGRW